MGKHLVKIKQKKRIGTADFSNGKKHVIRKKPKPKVK